jgi:hypothetical protein
MRMGKKGTEDEDKDFIIMKGHASLLNHIICN